MGGWVGRRLVGKSEGQGGCALRCESHQSGRLPGILDWVYQVNQLVQIGYGHAHGIDARGMRLGVTRRGKKKKINIKIKKFPLFRVQGVGGEMEGVTERVCVRMRVQLVDKTVVGLIKTKGSVRRTEQPQKVRGFG